MRVTIARRSFPTLDSATEAARRSLRRRARRRERSRAAIAQLPHTVSFPDQMPKRPTQSHQLVHDLGPRQLPLSILDTTSGRAARRLRVRRGTTQGRRTPRITPQSRKPRSSA